MAKPKTTTGTIIRHGEAPYQHDPNNSTNYFVELEVEKDKYETLWGVQLKELVESQQLEVGEKASFHKFKQETGANKWEVARFFAEEKLENGIERVLPQEKSAEKVSELGQVRQSADYKADDAEYVVPNAIRNRYLSVVVNKYTDSPMVKFYERDNPAAVAFEDRGDKGLHTSKSDKDTIKAMLDMAQSKGWESVKLKGSEEFKREAWMEAQMRGIKTKGYKPTEKDKLELQARQEERTTNQVEMVAQKAVKLENEKSPIPEMVANDLEYKAKTDRHNGALIDNIVKNAQDFNKNQQKSLKDQQDHEVSKKTVYEQLQEPKDSQAYLNKIGLDFGGASVERFAHDGREAKLIAKSFVGKELTNFHSGIQAVISNRNLDKMLSGKAEYKSVNKEIHAMAVANADRLFENSVFGWQSNYKNDSPDIEAVHRAIAPMKVNDEVYMAKLTIKEMTKEQGNRIYSIEAVDIEHEKSPVPEMTEEDTKKYGVTPHRLNEALIGIIVKNAQDFNKNHQKTLESDLNLKMSEFEQSLDTETDREAEIQAVEQHYDLKQVETEAYVRAEEFQRGRDIDPDLDMNIAGEAERFKTDVVAAPKVAGMTQAKVTKKVEAAFDRKIDGSMAAAKRTDFKKDLEENKAKLNETDKVKVEAIRRTLDFLHKDNPKDLQAGYEKLTTAIKNGEISKLPDVPQQVIQQNIEIQAPTQSDKDRGR